MVVLRLKFGYSIFFTCSKRIKVEKMKEFVESHFKKTERKFELRTTISMYLFCELSWPIYVGFLWFISLSQFCDPAIVCHGNNQQLDAEMVDSFCFFESAMVPWIGHPQQGYFRNETLLNDKQAYHFNRIYIYIVPILLICIFLSGLPKLIWKHSNCCQPLEEYLTKLTKRHLVPSLRYYDGEKLEELLVVSKESAGWQLVKALISMHLSALLALILMALLFFLAFYPNYSILIYGYDVLRFYLAESGFTEMETIDVHPSYKLFPLITKCTYFYFGQSGTLQQTDMICSLRINFILEKLCLFIWFYIVVMAILILYDLLFILSLWLEPLRKNYLQNALSRQYDTFPSISLNYPWTLLIILLANNIGHLNTMNLLEMLPYNTCKWI